MKPRCCHYPCLDAVAATTRAVRSTRRVESEHYLDAVVAMCD